MRCEVLIRSVRGSPLLVGLPLPAFQPLPQDLRQLLTSNCTRTCSQKVGLTYWQMLYSTICAVNSISNFVLMLAHLTVPPLKIAIQGQVAGLDQSTGETTILYSTDSYSNLEECQTPCWSSQNSGSVSKLGDEPEPLGIFSASHPRK